MERVAFLLERSGERISCLLNPENLEARRTAGVRTRLAGGGFLTGVARSEDPLIATGGGVTEYDLNLLFDVEVAREGRAPTAVEDGRGPAEDDDVRALTRCLETALMNPVESYQRGLAGRERVALNFRWDGTAERVLAGLEEVRYLRAAS